MLNTVVNFLFGCTHKKTTFPMTARGAAHRAQAHTYVVCLDCGKELPYSWEEMKMVPEHAQATTAGVGEQVRSFSATK